MFNLNLKKQVHFNSHMGGMGNQMFSYACAKNLELQHGYTCSLDDISKLKYFELAPGARLKNKLKMMYFFHVAKRMKGINNCNLQFNDLVEDYSFWLTQLDKPSMLWGFFQSEIYFLPSADEIKSYFSVKKQYQHKFLQFLKKNNLKRGAYNAVHVRRTDYIGFEVKGLKGNNFALPLEYFKKGLSYLGNSFPLVIVSDDPEYCKKELNGLDAAIFSEEDSITDFQLLSNAKELIISNSTFAWWASWLNPHQPKIICPDYFLGFKESKEVPINIYPSNWIKI